MELRMQDIAAAAANRATFQRGVEYYGQRRVSRLKIEPDIENGGKKITADVKGGKYTYEVEISLNDKNELEEGWCDCPAFYQYDGCCKHIVAVLLCYYYICKSTAPEIRQIANSTVTDHYAARMLNSYSKRQLSEAMGSALIKKVKLEPVLDYDYRGNMSLSMNIGHDRMYIIKDIGRFYDDMRSGNTVEYGARLSLTHAEGAFEEESRPLLDYFMNKYREYKNFRTVLGDPAARTGKRSLIITPGAFDEFFEIYKGRTIRLRMGVTDEPEVLLADENPTLQVKISDINGHAYLVGIEKNPMVYFGARHAYLFTNNRLYRCDEAFTDAARGFLFALYEKGEGLVINQAEMGTFCSDVLSMISGFMDVNADGCDLSRYEPTPMTAKLYIDMPTPVTVTAKLRFCYRELEIDALDEEIKPGLQRDIKHEYIARAVVEKYIGKYDLAKKHMYIDDEDKIYTLLSEGISEISSVAQVYTTDSLKRVNIKRPPVVSVGVRLSGSLLDISFDTEDFPKEELLNLLDSFRQHKKYHKLKDGTFINLENSAFEGVSELVDGLDLKRGDIQKGTASVHKYRAMYIDNIIKGSELLKSERDAGFKSMLRDIKDVDDADIQPCAELKPVLRNYQVKGFRWLKTMSRYGFGGILADDMGLGKTLEAIAFLQSIKDERQVKMPSIVICPASLVLNWESEILRFAPRMKPLPIIGNAQQRAQLSQTIPEYDVVITSYELLKRDTELYEKIEFDCEILDEAQFIKNYNTQNAKSVKSIRCQNRFALTGTPVENSLAELWSVFDFLMPGYLYTNHKFREEYEIPVMKQGDEQAGARLRQLTAPFILRRLKSSVLKELPPKTETVLYTNLEGEQKKLYLAALTGIREELTHQLKSQDAPRNKIIVLSMLTRLRQLCCDPSLYFEDYAGESAKLELCMELITSSTEAGHKLLLFSQFTSMLSIIGQRLEEAGISYYVLRGSTSKEERAHLINNFNSDQTQVFLISLRAGGTGLNLTAADIVIHYDPWWNISVQNQATDRAHRIGQRNSVQVYKLIAKDTIEEKIIKLQQEKLKLAESVITEGDGMISRMSESEIMALFED